MKVKKNSVLLFLLAIMFVCFISGFAFSVSSTTSAKAESTKTIIANITEEGNQSVTSNETPTGYQGTSYGVSVIKLGLKFDAVDISSFDSSKAAFEFWLYVPKGKTYSFDTTKDAQSKYNQWHTQWASDYIRWSSHCAGKNADMYDMTDIVIQPGWSKIQVPLYGLMAYNNADINKIVGFDLWGEDLVGMLMYGITFTEAETALTGLKVLEYQPIVPKNVVANITGGTTDVNVPNGYTGNSYKPVNANTFNINFTESVDVSSFDSTMAVFDFWLYLPEDDSYDFNGVGSYKYNRYKTEWNNVNFNDHCKYDFTNFEIKEGWNHIQLPLAPLMAYNLEGIKQITGFQLWADDYSSTGTQNTLEGMLVYGVAFKEVESPAIAVIEYQGIPAPKCDCCDESCTGECICVAGQACDPDCTCGNVNCKPEPTCDCCGEYCADCICEAGQACNTACDCGGLDCNYKFKTITAVITGGTTDVNLPNGYTGNSYKPVNVNTFNLNFETVDVTNFRSENAVFDFWLYLPKGDSYDFTASGATSYNRYKTAWNNVFFKDHCKYDFTGFEVKEGWNHIQLPLAPLMKYSNADIKKITGFQLWADDFSLDTNSAKNTLEGMLIYGLTFKEIETPALAVIEYQALPEPTCDCCDGVCSDCICEKGQDCDPNCDCGGKNCNYEFKNIEVEVIGGTAESVDNIPKGYDGESYKSTSNVKLVLTFETVDVTNFRSENAVFDFWLYLPKGDTYDFEKCAYNRWSTEWSGNYINLKTHCKFDFTNFEIKEGWNHIQLPLAPLMKYSDADIKKITGFELWADDYSTGGTYENGLEGILVYGLTFKEIETPTLAVIEYQAIPEPTCDCCEELCPDCICEKGQDCDPNCDCGGKNCNYEFKNIEVEVIGGTAESVDNTPKGYDGESYKSTSNVKLVLTFETVDVTNFRSENAVFDFWLYLPKGDTYDFGKCAYNRWSTEWTGNYIKFKEHCKFDFTDFEIKEGWNHVQIPLAPLMAYSQDGIKRITGFELWADDFSTGGTYENGLEGILLYGLTFKEIETPTLAVIEYQALPTSITLSTNSINVTKDANIADAPIITFGPAGSEGAVVYTSSDKFIANVVDGKVVGYANGTAIITVSLAGDDSVKATFTVNVSGYPEVESLIVTGGNEIKLAPMERKALEVKPDKEGINVALSYKSSNPAIVIVSSNGTLTAVGEGTATITVKLEGTNVQTVINVTVEATTQGKDPEQSGTETTSGGCGSFVGTTSIVAFTALTACAIVSLKKKSKY